MSIMVTELYDALRKAGVDEQLARDAARAVLGYDTRTELATKADLARLEAATKADLARLEAATKAALARLEAATKAALAELKVELIKWNVGAMAVLTAIFAAISRLG
ncbi:MAG: hypothetical protein HYY76_15595 [Acidobacteria bacterium]|nr:hypothetical protein [Acidobacteriota bacterium]